MTEANEGWASNNKINWDEEDNDAPPQAPEGVYSVLIVAASPEKTAKGEAGLKIEFEIKARRDGSDLGRINRKGNCKFGFGKDVRYRIKNLCKATGVAGPENDSVQGVGEFCARLLETDPVWCRIKHRSYNGRAYLNVDTFFTEAESNEAAAAGDGGGGYEPEAAVSGGRRRRA